MLRYRKEQSRIYLAFGNGMNAISSMKLMMVLFIIYGWYSNFKGAQVSLLIILLNTRGQNHVASCLSQPHDCQLERRANCHLEQLQTLGHYIVLQFWYWCTILIFLNIQRRGSSYYITFFLFTAVLSHLLSHLIRKSTKSSWFFVHENASRRFIQVVLFIDPFSKYCGYILMSCVRIEEHYSLFRGGDRYTGYPGDSG